MWFTSILTFLTGLGGVAKYITGRIADLKIEQVKADSNVQRQQITAEIEALHDRRAVLVAEAGTRIGALLNAIARGILAAPAAAILWKLAYDHVVGPFYGCVG